MKKKMMMGLVAMVVLGGVFFGGMKYGQANIKGNFQANLAGGFQNGGATGMARAGGANIAGGFVTGDVIAKDTQSLTIKLRDGSTKIVLYSGSTEVSKFDAGTVNDLVVGKSVSITGSTNTDGSLTAKTIQVRPPMPSPSSSPAQ